MLKKYDQPVDLADNGRIAVEKFRAKNYDVILMDIHMPELNGFEAAMQIREIEQLENRPKKVKIFAVTASCVTDEKENCKLAGMDGYLGKPFKTHEVMEILAC